MPRITPLREFLTSECPHCDGTGFTLDHKALGQYARQLREQADKSLRSVASEMEISAAYLSDLERGRRNWADGLWDDFLEALK